MTERVVRRVGKVTKREVDGVLDRLTVLAGAAQEHETRGELAAACVKEREAMRTVASLLAAGVPPWVLVMTLARKHAPRMAPCSCGCGEMVVSARPCWPPQQPIVFAEGHSVTRPGASCE